MTYEQEIQLIAQVTTIAKEVIVNRNEINELKQEVGRLKDLTDKLRESNRTGKRI
jgi:hypothetical protein